MQQIPISLIHLLTTTHIYLSNAPGHLTSLNTIDINHKNKR